jgi:hypothetical protein
MRGEEDAQMLKPVSSALVALFVVAGCVTVGPSVSTAPSAQLSVAPSLGVTTPAPLTPAPTVARTSVPSLAPTSSPTPTPVVSAVPTQQPTLAATQTPAETSSPGGTFGVSDRDVLFYDEMDDPSSGWSTADEDFANVSYDSGALAMRFNQNPAWALSVRALDVPDTTVVVAGEFEPESGGIFGQACGDSTSGIYYGAVVTTDGGLVFIEVANSDVTVLHREDSLGLDVSLGDSNEIALECSITSDGAAQFVVGLAHTGPIAVYRQDSAGVTTFDEVGVYGEASSDGYTLAVLTAAAWGVGGPLGTMSEGAQMLLAHIPEDLQKNCYESPLWNGTATYVVTCLPRVSGKGAEIEQYQQFDSKDAMDAAYHDVVQAFGVDSTGSCQSGPNETAWDDTSGVVGGRVECAPQTVGIRFDWTDDLTSIVSTLVDLDGSYKDTYDQWVNAGPIIPQG